MPGRLRVLLESALAFGLLAGGNYADYRTTKDALASCQACKEANPLIGAHGERLLAVKLGSLAAEQLTFEILRKKHKKAAWLFVAGTVAANLLIAKHNGGFK